MEGETLVRLEKVLGRELEQSEKERLQRIQDVLKIWPNDALGNVQNFSHIEWLNRLDASLSRVHRKFSC